MKATTTTKATTPKATKARKQAPTPEAVNKAKARAVADIIRESETPEKKARAAEAEKKARAARREADKLTKAWKKARAAAEAETVEALENGTKAEAAAALDNLTDEARSAYLAAKKARAAALAAEERAEALTAAADLAADLADRMRGGDDLFVVVRLKTPADLAAEKTAAALAAAAEAVEKLKAADPAAKKSADPEKLKAARAALKAAEAEHKAAKVEAKAAEATAPRYHFAIGVMVDESRPTAAAAIGHAIADRAAAALRIPAACIARTSVYFNIAEHPEHIYTAARMVAKRTTVNAINRQGTPTQWSMFYAAARRDWDTTDLADLVGEAAAALVMLTASREAADREARAAEAFRAIAATLKKLSPADREARAAYMTAAREASKAYTRDRETDPRIIEDPDRLKSRAEAIEIALTAREAARAADPLTAAEKISRAAFRAVNNYLADNRAIRDSAKAPALNVEKIAETITDPRDLIAGSISEFDARRRAILRPALAAALESMTPATREALNALWKTGGAVRLAADKIGKNESTVREHRKKAAAAIAAALAVEAPESIERRAFGLVAYTDGIKAAEAAADLAAAKAKTEAAKAKAEAVKKLKAARADLAADIAAAIAEAVESLPPAMKEAAALLARGSSQREAADKLNKSRATVREAARKAADRIAAAIAAAAPDLEIDPAIIARADLAALVALAAAA